MLWFYVIYTMSGDPGYMSYEKTMAHTSFHSQQECIDFGKDAAAKDPEFFKNYPELDDLSVINVNAMMHNQYMRFWHCEG